MVVSNLQSFSIDLVNPYRRVVVLVLRSLLLLDFYFYKNYVSKKENRIKFDRNVLNIPLLGNFILNSELERFSSTMELLLASGTNLDVALEECSKIFGNKYLSNMVLNAKNDVVEGKDFIVSLVIKFL